VKPARCVPEAQREFTRSSTAASGSLSGGVVAADGDISSVQRHTASIPNAKPA